jgi:peptidoglycan hydrolase CwlO-like protein
LLRAELHRLQEDARLGDRLQAAQQMRDALDHAEEAQGSIQGLKDQVQLTWEQLQQAQQQSESLRAELQQAQAKMDWLQEDARLVASQFSARTKPVG